MPWLLASSGHQQPWYWLCRIGRSLCYLIKDFNYLCHINVEEWHKILIYVLCSPWKFRTQRVYKFHNDGLWDHLPWRLCQAFKIFSQVWFSVNYFWSEPDYDYIGHLSLLKQLTHWILSTMVTYCNQSGTKPNLVAKIWPPNLHWCMATKIGSQC